jgi:hypothetical protein
MRCSAAVDEGQTIHSYCYPAVTAILTLLLCVSTSHKVQSLLRQLWQLGLPFNVTLLKACSTLLPVVYLQASYPSVQFTIVNLARGGNDVSAAATCWYQLAPQVRTK